MSTVRWQPASKIEKVPSMHWKRDHLGDLLEKGYVTMAMTRAKRGLIIIGELQVHLVPTRSMIFKITRTPCFRGKKIRKYKVNK